MYLKKCDKMTICLVFIEYLYGLGILKIGSFNKSVFKSIHLDM